MCNKLSVDYVVAVIVVDDENRMIVIVVVDVNAMDFVDIDVYRMCSVVDDDNEIVDDEKQSMRLMMRADDDDGDDRLVRSVPAEYLYRLIECSNENLIMILVDYWRRNQRLMGCWC